MTLINIASINSEDLHHSEFQLHKVSCLLRPKIEGVIRYCERRPHLKRQGFHLARLVGNHSCNLLPNMFKMKLQDEQVWRRHDVLDRSSMQGQPEDP